MRRQVEEGGKGGMRDAPRRRLLAEEERTVALINEEPSCL